MNPTATAKNHSSGSSANLLVEVQNVTSAGSAPAPERVRKYVSETVASARDGNMADLELSVRFVDEDEARALNSQYRSVDSATNVLSFSAEQPGTELSNFPRPLGDVVICGPLVESEARAQGKQAGDHWAHLLVHGTLHLLGYDHERQREAAAMEALEIRILAALGVDDPYRSGRD